MSEMICFEIRVFLVFLFHGVFLMLCSDLLRSWRIAVPHGKWWIGAEDACFWLMAGIWTFVLIFIYQDGILRLYMAAAAGLGMVIYRKTFSPRVVKWVSGLFFLIIRFLRKCRYLISRLLKKIDILRQKTIAKVVEKE